MSVKTAETTTCGKQELRKAVQSQFGDLSSTRLLTRRSHYPAPQGDSPFIDLSQQKTRSLEARSGLSCARLAVSIRKSAFLRQGMPNTYDGPTLAPPTRAQGPRHRTFGWKRPRAARVAPVRPFLSEGHYSLRQYIKRQRPSTAT